MSLKSKLKKSRNNWKRKAIERGKSERYQRKENIRIRKERDRYKEELRAVKKQIEKESRVNKPSVRSKEELVYISLQLFFLARIGFRAVSRVLGVLGEYLGIVKAPCPQTIINWGIRLSIAKIRNKSQLSDPRISKDIFSNGDIWILDTSIGLGSGKILVVLSLNADYHALNKTAPTLKEINCVAVAVADSWTGENIADFLQKVIGVTGRPVAYLKDGGTDLSKAVRILDERGLASPTINDISHFSANLLKHEYQNHSMFETFISVCGRVSKKLKQTVLGCLAPPKVTTKSRFMNLHRLVKWSALLLRCSPRGRASKDSVLSKLRSTMNGLPECKTFITRFLHDADLLSECQKILKTKGLCKDTRDECRKLTENFSPQSSVLKGFTDWIECQFQLSVDLGLEKSGMPVSSDSTESLFGVAKQHGTGEMKDAGRIALRIPGMCGQLSVENVRQVLNISVEEQQKVTGSLPSLIKQRREVLTNPERLEEIFTDEKKRYFELIPEVKKRSKNLININFSDPYNETTGPPDHMGEQELLLPKICFLKASNG